MEYKEILGLLASIIAAGISLAYIYTIVRGKTRPHLYTVGIDAVISSIVLAGAFVAGAGAGIWSLAVSTVFVLFMVLLCFTYGTKDVKPVDAYFAAAALLTVVPWMLTKDPTLSIVLASVINLLSVVPAFRKTWNDPYSEPVVIWGLNGAKHVVAIAATAVISVATIFYSVSIIIMNLAFVLMMLYRRQQKRPPAAQPSVPGITLGPPG